MAQLSPPKSPISCSVTKAQLREAAKSCVACALGKGVSDYCLSSAARHTCTSRVRFAQAPQVLYVAKWLHDDPDALALLRQADQNTLRQDAIERALPQLLAEIELDNAQLPEVRDASPSTPTPSRSPPVAVNPSEVRPTARPSRTAADETLHLRSARRNLSPPPTTDTSNGPRGVEGVFLGCDRTTPRVRNHERTLGSLILTASSSKRPSS
jgi:hypothetical protein